MNTCSMCDNERDDIKTYQVQYKYQKEPKTILEWRELCTVCLNEAREWEANEEPLERVEKIPIEESMILEFIEMDFIYKHAYYNPSSCDIGDESDHLINCVWQHYMLTHGYVMIRNDKEEIRWQKWQIPLKPDEEIYVDNKPNDKVGWGVDYILHGSCPLGIALGLDHGMEIRKQ